MTKLYAAIDLVAIATPFFEASDNPTCFEIRYDVLNRSFGNPDLDRHIPENFVPSLVQTKKDMGMVRKKRPMRVIFGSWGNGRLLCLNSHDASKRVSRKYASYLQFQVIHFVITKS